LQPLCVFMIHNLITCAVYLGVMNNIVLGTLILIDHLNFVTICSDTDSNRHTLKCYQVCPVVYLEDDILVSRSS